MMNRHENQEINDRVSIGRVDKIKNPDHRYVSPSVKDRRKATQTVLDLQYETKKPNYIFGMNDSANEFQTWNKSKIGYSKDDPTVTSLSLSDASNNDRTYVSTSSQSHSSDNRSSVGSQRRRPPRPLSPKPPEGNRKSLPPRREGSISGSIRESESDIHRIGSIQTINDKNRKLSFPPRNEGGCRILRASDDGTHANVSTNPSSDTRKLPTRKSGGSGDLSLSEEGGTHTILPKGLNTRTMPPRYESLATNYDSEDDTRRRIRSMRPVRKDSISKDQPSKPVETQRDILSSPIVVSKATITSRDQESHQQFKKLLSHPHPSKYPIEEEEEELDLKDIQEYREKNNRMSSRNEKHYSSDSHLFASIVRKQSYTGLNDRLHASISQMGEIKQNPKEQSTMTPSPKEQSTMTPSRIPDAPVRQKTSSEESELDNPFFLFKLSQSLQGFTGPEKITSRYLAKLSEKLEMPVAYSCQKGLELVTSEGLVLVSDLLKLDA
jgi:hypothetical protein